ncbi:MAG: thiamine pyrophosphate-dependent enzyme [Myxococcota bacterium]|jgi:2-oxoglutarate ferredoxin oxidoreductase subunit beta|nr:thiamine pyrophosphate-dependent enzyme [Myxococcota bacterium]
MYGLKQDWALEPRLRHFVIEDYQGLTARWCPGCGDHSVLGAVQRLCRDLQLAPEKTVVVSGIGCSSRFPHYMNTYGFHGLHGRAMPVACGVRARRPDLNIFTVTGDGDCCAIGTAHWIHAVRYNMKMTVLLLDNNIYGLTKMQTSPTTGRGQFSNTHPGGAPLSPLNPLSVMLGITNCSFVAQTVDWNPGHLMATLRKAFDHDGFAFVRIRQRCPHYMPKVWDELIKDPSKLLLLQHPEGIPTDDAVERVLSNRVEHDPTDYLRAHELAARDDVVPVGLIYKNPNAERYDLYAQKGLEMSPEERVAAINRELDRFTV